MVKDWTKVIDRLAEKVGLYAQIDWIEIDYWLGTAVKRIFFYHKGELIGSEPFSENRVNQLRKSIPVVDLTEEAPYPPFFLKLPRRIIVLGRLNLAELGL